MSTPTESTPIAPVADAAFGLSAPTFADNKLFLLRVKCKQGDSPHVIGASLNAVERLLGEPSAVSWEVHRQRAMPAPSKVLHLVLPDGA